MVLQTPRPAMPVDVVTLHVRVMSNVSDNTSRTRLDRDVGQGQINPALRIFPPQWPARLDS